MIDGALTATIIGFAFKVHKALGPGFQEKVYENALRIDLVEHGLCVKQQEPLKVWYGGQVVGEYSVDLLVEDRIIVELKAVRALAKEHEVQLVNYLTATNMDIGLLINFGSSVQIKRKHREYKAPITFGQDL